MFSMEIYLKAGRDLRLGKASIDGKQKHAPKMDGRVSYVFDPDKKDKDFDICIKQKAAYNWTDTVTMHHKCC